MFASDSIEPCVHANDCGGCPEMGTPYSEQMLKKTQAIKTHLEDLSLSELGSIHSENPVGYRTRVLLRAHHTPGENLQVGYFRKASRVLAPVSACSVACPTINRLVGDLAASRLEVGVPQRVRLEVQALAAMAEKLLVTIYPGLKDRTGLDAIIERIRQLPYIAWVGSLEDAERAPIFLLEQDLGINFFTKPATFQQVNRGVNSILRRRIVDYAAATNATRVLDLYCGNGNFSLALAKPNRFVIGIESNEAAVLAANHAVRINALPNAQYESGQTERAISNYVSYGPDLMIVDPPRRGLDPTLAKTITDTIKPAHLIYLSCNQTQLRQDLAHLQIHKYIVRDVDVCDFFAQTDQAETVVFLQRR